MLRLDYPRLPVVISLVLGGGIERTLHQSLAMSNGSWTIFVLRPVGVVLVLWILAVLFATPARAGVRRMLAQRLPGGSAP
jgi:putative tricarboxylic transport membrane protein